MALLSELRYAALPEVIEFYTGIDRMRLDAVTQLTNDLNGMDANFISRSGINPDFNPYANASWNPTPAAIERMQADVAESIQDSTLPTEVKDAVADGSYDRSKPYHQQVSQFMLDASLPQMVQAMKGAARALRNSDHVDPKAKAELLEAVVRCWTRMCQALAVISPILATNRRAQFDGMGFFLDDSFDAIVTQQDTWRAVMSAIVDNVISWYQNDLFSKKLGPLLGDLIQLHRKNGDLAELLILLVVIKQRPGGWQKTIEDFIIRSDKNSFTLLRVYVALRHEFRFGLIKEYTKQDVRRLAAMSSAKHGIGSKRPNQKLIGRVAALFDKEVAEAEQAEASGSGE